jgi:hypothetical protein
MGNDGSLAGADAANSGSMGKKSVCRNDDDNNKSDGVTTR